MTNLGEKQSSEPMLVTSKKEPKVSYPSLCIRDKSLEAVFGKTLPQVGDEIEATLELRVRGVSSDEYGKRVEFDVVAGDFEEPEAKEEDAPEDAKGMKYGMEESDGEDD